MHPIGIVLMVLLYFLFNGIIALAWTGQEEADMLTVAVLMLAGLPIMAVSFIVLIVASGIVMVTGDYRRERRRRK